MTIEEIENAKDILQNCIADYVIGSFCTNKDCMDKDMCKDKDCPYEIAIDTVIEYIEQLENRIKELETERDYYKKMYLECNAAFTETALKDLEKRYEVYRTCLHCGEGQPNYCERCYQELIAENLKLQRK